MKNVINIIDLCRRKFCDGNNILVFISFCFQNLQTLFFLSLFLKEKIKLQIFKDIALEIIRNWYENVQFSTKNTFIKSYGPLSSSVFKKSRIFMRVID